ncbi:glycosyltransferase family 2 protein [Bacillus cereus]|uniref:Glycosyltransferase 2-like domain-containing protein n=1 Tax=Bacillus cereus TaxID=1396 RepID=A0AA44TF67_BACCE|nr:glycosyltransferase family 2 protein [Bacillus cereus]PFN07056.1 hypothetical protein COJ55_11970 [Bacillus cereus]PFS02794.1 hypothetical protein COK38_08635 [Bacillus cereus]PGZ12844.1 hypothetical protein COE46_22630 [Bacillus cereus]
MIDVSIVIVTYNSEKDIYPCLSSIILSNTKATYEVIIVDNDSKDNTCKIVNDFIKGNEHSNIQLLKSENKGFNAGNNVGIKSAQGEYVLLLNPDTEVFPDTLDSLYNNAKNITHLGSLGCVMKSKSGEEIFSAGYFPSVKSSIRKMFKKNKVVVNHKLKIQPVDFPAGSTFLFKKSLINEIGLMDEKYFLYYDETDFAYQMAKAGYKNYILTSTAVIHKFGQSTKDVSSFSIEKNIESYFYFLRKNYNSLYRKIIMAFELSSWFIYFLIAFLLKHKSYKYFRLNLEIFRREMMSHSRNEKSIS